MDQVIAELDKSGNEKIRFSITDWRDNLYVNVRTYYETDEGDWKPTRKGITVSLGLFSEFHKHLQSVHKQLSKKGLLDN